MVVVFSIQTNGSAVTLASGVLKPVDRNVVAVVEVVVVAVVVVVVSSGVRLGGSDVVGVVREGTMAVMLGNIILS